MIPIAWLVGNTAFTVPLNGAITFPSAGIIANPFPITSFEKVSSLTSLSEINFPAIGEIIPFVSTISSFSVFTRSIAITKDDIILIKKAIITFVTFTCK